VAELIRHLVWYQDFNQFDAYLEKPHRDEQDKDQNAQTKTENPEDGELAELRGKLSSAGIDPSHAIPLLAPLLNLQLAERSSLSPEEQRQRVLGILVEWIIGADREQPVVLVVEDLHWADPRVSSC